MFCIKNRLEQKTAGPVGCGSETWNKRPVWPIIIGIMASLILEGFLGYRSVLYGYGQGGRKLPLFLVETQGYQITDQYYAMAASESYMVWNISADIGYIDVMFEQPVSGNTVVIAYTGSGGEKSFDRFRRIERYMMDGTEMARIPIQANAGEWIRLDIRSSFQLDRIEAGIRQRVQEITPWMVLRQMNVLRILVCTLFFSTGCYGFSRWIRERKKVKQEDKKRVIYLDGLRVMAAFLVICTHVIEPAKALLQPGTVLYAGMSIAVQFCLSCNFLFVYLSGALLLPWREETVGYFIKRRIMRVVLPLLVYSFFYLRFQCVTIAGFSEWMEHWLHSFLRASIPGGPHIWLVFVLIQLYVLTLPLRWMLHRIGERGEKCLAATIFAWFSVRTVWMAMGVYPELLRIFTGWPCVFIMGFLLTRPWMRRFAAIWLAGGGIFLVSIIWVAEIRPDYTSFTSNGSVFMLCISAAVWVVFQCSERGLQPVRRILSFISQYSYSILLIHLYVLNAWVYHGMFSSSIARSLQIILPIAACSFLSFLSALAIDHTVMPVLDYVIEAVCRGKRKRDS